MLAHLQTTHWQQWRKTLRWDKMRSLYSNLNVSLSLSLFYLQTSTRCFEWRKMETNDWQLKCYLHFRGCLMQHVQCFKTKSSADNPSNSYFKLTVLSWHLCSLNSWPLICFLIFLITWLTFSVHWGTCKSIFTLLSSSYLCKWFKTQF